VTPWVSLSHSTPTCPSKQGNPTLASERERLRLRLRARARARWGTGRLLRLRLRTGIDYDYENAHAHDGEHVAQGGAETGRWVEMARKRRAVAMRACLSFRIGTGIFDYGRRIGCWCSPLFPTGDCCILPPIDSHLFTRVADAAANSHSQW